MPKPVRDSSEGVKETREPNSPEALLISALIEDGNFDPAHWRISDEDLACYTQLWRFCCDHHTRTGRAPSKEMLRKTHDYFEIIPDVDPEWAAGKLREASSLRQLRERINISIASIKDEDLEGAYAAFDGLMVPVAQRRAPHDGFSHHESDDEHDEFGVYVPYDPVGRASGGIKLHDVWALAARLSQGKTTIACCYAAEAVKDGWKVCYLSREMPDHQISKKVNRYLAARDKKLLAMLDGNDKKARYEAREILAHRVTPGSFSVYDPTHGPCDPSTVRDALAEYDLVFIDHIGLMTMRGKALISDWRLAAECSNKLKEHALQTDSRLFEVVQINRAGETMSPTRAPKMSEIAGTDAIPQDADVAITMNRYSTSVMLHSAEKVRLGPTVRWYSRFDPEHARFEQISRDKATELAVSDEDRMERSNR